MHTKFCPIVISHRLASAWSFILQGHNVSSLNCTDSCCLKNSLGTRITEILHIKQNTAPKQQNKTKGWSASLKTGSVLFTFKDGLLLTIPTTYDMSIIIFNDTSSISSRFNTPKTCFAYCIHWLHKLSCLKLFISSLNINISDSGGPWPTL